ncbi:MAG TPA: methylated-DNA--[protein]-cysteine S-methyltransferase [Labilithrix sp.]
MAWTLFETTLGLCGVAWSDAGVTWVQLPEADDEATRERLAAKTKEPRARTNPPWVKDAIARIREHLAGKPQDLSRVPLDLSRASEFNASVYRALQRVPAGTTTTYGDLARLAGAPDAARAVGRAMAQNPFPLLVPCHRVLAAAGKPGGFSAYGGRVTKEKLLAVEGALLQTSLFDGRHALPFDWSAAVEHVAAADGVLAKHIERVGPSRKLMLKASEGTFATLVESIVYQQLNGKAAATILGRVRQIYPGGVLDPERVLATPESKLRMAGLSRGKLASLRDLAARTHAGEIPTLPELERMDDEAIVERLTNVRGIGRWTVEMLLIFRLGRPDVLPVADYGIRKGFAQIFARGRAKAELPAPTSLVKRGERWRPFRSVASFYLWRALDTS